MLLEREKKMKANISQNHVVSDLWKKSFENVSKTVYKLRENQILSYQHFRSNGDFKVFKALKYKKKNRNS